jgi:hypothetical protein
MGCHPSESSILGVRSTPLGWRLSAARTHGRRARTTQSTRRLEECASTRTSSNPAVRHCAAKDCACWSVQPWLANPVAPGRTRRSIASSRPPGTSTRRASASPTLTSFQWCTVATHHSTVADSSGCRRSSAVASAHVIPPCCRVNASASLSMTGAGSTPIARAPRRAASRTAVPGPQPTSITRSVADTDARLAARRAIAPRPGIMVSPASSPVMPAKPGWSA